MPDSQKIAELAGSYTIQDGRLVIPAEPAPVPSCVQALPEALDQRLWRATPAMTWLDRGTLDTRVKLPHSEGRPPRLPVTSTHAPGGGGGKAAWGDRGEG